MRTGRMVIMILVLLCTNVAAAAPTWYHGKVTRVAMLSGNDFIVTLAGGVVSDCAYGYVYFRESVLGAQTIKSAYAMALSAFLADKTMGIIVDKAINGPGGTCNQEGNMFDITP